MVYLNFCIKRRKNICDFPLCNFVWPAIHARAKNDAGAKPGDKVVVESSTEKLLGVAALVYLLPVAGFLLGYFLTAGLPTEGWRYAAAIAAAALFFLPSVFYDRRAKREESLTYTILRLF